MRNLERSVMIGRTVFVALALLAVGGLFGGCASTRFRPEGKPAEAERGATVRVQLKSGELLRGILVDEDEVAITLQVEADRDTLLRLDKDAVFFIETEEPPAHREPSWLVTAGLFIVFLVGLSYALFMTSFHLS